MSMFDAVMSGALAAVGLTPEEANEMIKSAFAKVDDIHSTIKRMEARQKKIAEKLGVPPLQEVLTAATEDDDNGGQRSETG